MPRVDQQGVRHPTSLDPFDTADAPHVRECESCRSTDWGRNLLWLVDHQIALPIF
ncbi:hypothetical protein SEA_OTTAWA_23 [Arthrobacter phage Ottawa]|nr:hypothetical protein SEA_KHARCHO_23 [Arthrobacter phage Kharcho]WIC89255.1 hypothetical protein SEA_OTTAWA_23 [Arthrobacter phage Ottawa]